RATSAFAASSAGSNQWITLAAVRRRSYRKNGSLLSSGPPRPGGQSRDEAFQGRDQPRCPGLDAGLAAVPGGAGAGGGAERPRRPLRRHRLRGVVAVRWADRDADDAAAGGRRAHVLAVAHDGALLADAVVLPHRTEPSSERFLADRRGCVRGPG